MESVDALRGLTIAGMIVVNTPGTWNAIYGPLRHASWHGLTPTDLVFPFFLLIVGISVALAYSRPRASGGVGRHRRIGVRTAKLFALGVLLNLWPEFEWESLRVAGVLQRIALVFAAAALLFLHLRTRALLGLTCALLVTYHALLLGVPVPRDAVADEALSRGTVERAHGERVPVSVQARDATTLVPNLEPGTNLAAWVDRRTLPGRFYERTWDPEGVLSTIPSLATALLGCLTGLALRRYPAPGTRAVGLLVGGTLLLVLGYLWAVPFPLNKNLWTSSFVLVSAGWALVVLAVLTWLIEHRGQRRWFQPALVFGANAITAYVLAGMLTVVFLRPWIGDRSVAEHIMAMSRGLGASPELASLLFALLYTSFIFIPLLVLYRRRIFVRL